MIAPALYASGRCASETPAAATPPRVWTHAAKGGRWTLYTGEGVPEGVPVLFSDTDPNREPERRRKKATPVDTLTPEQVAGIIAEAPADAPGVRFAAMTSLMYATGLRISECCQLRAGAIRSDASGVSLVSVPNEDGCKTGARVVPVLTSRLQPYLLAHLESRGESEWLFPTYRGTHVHPNAYTRALKLYARRAGITTPVHAHMFRHTFATEYLRKGGTVAELQALLGHTTGTMSMKYAAHVGVDELARRAAALG